MYVIFFNVDVCFGIFISIYIRIFIIFLNIERKNRKWKKCTQDDNKFQDIICLRKACRLLSIVRYLSLLNNGKSIFFRILSVMYNYLELVFEKFILSKRINTPGTINVTF